MTTRDDALAAPHAAPLWLLQFDFATGTQRYTNWTHSLEYFGHTWTGLGAVVGVSIVTQSEDLQFPAVDVQLNVANAGVLALALGTPAPYRNRPITIWQALLDDELKPAGDPEVIWAGLMDQLRFDTGDGSEEGRPAAVMRCEMPGRDKRGATSLRLTHGQQQQRFPGDTGLSRIEWMLGVPQLWLSKRFQMQD